VAERIFAAAPDAMAKGAVGLHQMSRTASEILGDLINVIEAYPNPGGDGDVGKAFENNYDPAAKSSRQFLQGLEKLIATHGDQTADLAGIFRDTSHAASIQAGRSPAKGH